MIHEETAEGPETSFCPRCGADAQSRVADSDENRVEVTCPDCGRFDVTKVAFDDAQADIVVPDLEE